LIDSSHDHEARIPSSKDFSLHLFFQVARIQRGVVRSRISFTLRAAKKKIEAGFHAECWLRRGQCMFPCLPGLARYVASRSSRCLTD